MIDQASILVIGQNGQLARALKRVVPGARFLGRPELDLTTAASIDALPLSGIRYIINASAYTQVDKAETSEGRTLAWQVNATAVAHLAKVAAVHRCILVHVSTEYVFDGMQGEYAEDENTSPINTYGQSKAAGECAVQVLSEYYLIRTQWLIGEGDNFVRTMLTLGKKGVHPKVVSDQTGRLTFASTLAAGILHLLENRCAYGIYNISNSGPVVSWADIAKKVFTLANLPTIVSPITTAEYLKDKATAAQRPLQCALNLEKIYAAGFIPSDWQTELASYIAA